MCEQHPIPADMRALIDDRLEAIASEEGARSRLETLHEPPAELLEEANTVFRVLVAEDAKCC